MLLTSPEDRSDESRTEAAGSHRERRKKIAFAGAILLSGVAAFPAPVFAQYGKGGFGAMMNQGMQPPPQYYQPPPGYQSEQYQPPYQQQQTSPYLQYEENEQMKQANTGSLRVKKRKAHAPVATARAADGVITVKMKKTGGTFEVPVRINNAVTTDFTVDSGAADVMIPANVVSALIKSGALKQEDYVGGQTFTLADGSKLPSVRFKLASLRVGDQTLTDVVASVAPAAGSALLGQSFLSRFASWTLDNTTGTLNLTMRSANSGQIAAASAPSGAPDSAPAAEAPAPVAATSIQPADATKPPSGDVAPDKAAALATATSPGPDAGAHTGFVLPAFPDQTKYADARAHLIALGYEPQQVHLCGPNSTPCYPERVSCFGTDVIQCKFEWKRGDTTILVQTMNYPPTVTNVECEKNCQ
jgi:clan AA aspartic protease (TIGR02281 family)